MTSYPEDIFVVAGNRHQFDQYTKEKWEIWTKEWNNNPSNPMMYPNYIYVENEKRLIGLSKVKGFFIGTWKERDDIEEIKLRIELIKGRSPQVKQHSAKKDYDIFLNGDLLDHSEYHFGPMPIGRNSKTAWYITLYQAPPEGSSLTIKDHFGSEYKQYCLKDQTVFEF